VLYSKEKKEESPMEMIDKLDSTILAIEVRIKAIHYQCTQHTLKAKQFHADSDEIRCKAELVKRQEKQQTYKRFVTLQTNLCRIRDSLDNTQTFGEIANNMGLANKILEDALKQVDPERIDDLMDQLMENSIYVREVGDALSRDIDGGELELELEEEVILPSLPPLPQSKKKTTPPVLIHQ